MKQKRWIRSAMTLVFALLMVFGRTQSALAAVDVPELRELPTRDDIVVDPSDYYKVMLDGYYHTPVNLDSAGTISRDLRMYVPADSAFSQPSVYIMLPNGYGEGAKDPYEFLEESGWREVSDAKKLTIILMMPENGVWGSYEEEVTYLKCSYEYTNKRPFLPTCEYNKYLVAYDEATELGTKFTMNEGKWWSGALMVGSTGIDAAYVEKMQSEDSYVAGVSKSEVPVPMWIVSSTDTSDVDRLVDYWKNANQTDASASGSDLADAYYAPDPDADVGQPDSEPVAPVYYSQATTQSVMNSDFAEQVWENMFKGVRRYSTFANWGLRSYTPLLELGATLNTAMVGGGTYTSGGSTVELPDYQRSWYVYVPDSVDRSARNPVLFLFNGRSGFGDEIASRTGWQGLCEQEGVILVALNPSIYTTNESYNGLPINPIRTGWNTSASASGPNDLLFVDYVQEWLCDEQNGYADIVDDSRFYAAGQSMGGSFTHGLIANRPQSFAAAAPISWVATPGSSANTDVDIAVINMMGQQDTTIRNAFAGSSGANIFNHYITRYNLSDPTGKTSYSDFTYMEEDAVCSEKDGRLNKYIFNTAAGYTMFEAVEVVDMIHATMPSILPEAWSFMEKYSRDPDTLVLYYDGEVVDTPVNLELAKTSRLKLRTDSYFVREGAYFEVNTSFDEEIESNAIVLDFSFDGNLYSFSKFEPADGVIVVLTEKDANSARITLMVSGYDAQDLGGIILSAKQDVQLKLKAQAISVDADYVLRDEDGVKTALTGYATTAASSGGSGGGEGPEVPGDTNGDGVVDILDLSNLIDWFGYTSAESRWNSWYTYFDFNNNGEIDIMDIAHVARII